MPIYSHSQLSMYGDCPLRYKLCYRDRIKRDVESIEAFLGSRVHDTLQKCYNDLKYTKMNSPDDLLAFYDGIWRKNWHDQIVVSKKDLAAENYKALGEKLIKTYYKRYAPFDSDVTIATELNLNFLLDDSDKYRLAGYIDRLSRAKDGAYEIHDYKTSSFLPAQESADNDRQLGLYHLGVQKKWPEVQNIRLVWHYLAFDTELVSFRTPQALSDLVGDTKNLIDKIEADTAFTPKESGLCEWCEYPDRCPKRKHFCLVENLPANKYLDDPGVVLVNKYAGLKAEASEIASQMEMVKEALVEYARREQVEMIRGSDCKARVRFDEKLKFPGKNEPERQELDNTLIKAGKWMEVSQLDTSALTKIVECGQWSKELIDEVLKHGCIEETSAVYLSKLKEEEK